MCASTCGSLLAETSQEYAIYEADLYYEVNAGELTDLAFTIYNTYADAFVDGVNSVPEAYEISLEEGYDETLITSVTYS